METQRNSAVTPVAATPEAQAKAPPYPESDDDFQRLTADISARLRRVCAHLPDDEFSELVLDIARVTKRYESRVTPVRPDHSRVDD